MPSCLVFYAFKNNILRTGQWHTKDKECFRISRTLEGDQRVVLMEMSTIHGLGSW